MTNSWRALLLVTLLGPAVPGCLHSHPEYGQSDDPGERLAGRLVFSGSSTMAPLVEEIGQRFCVIHPGVQIEVLTGGSGRGIVEARSGTVAIGMASRALFADEGDLFGFPIARDGVCILVHGDNPVKGLTDRQISDVFSGKIGNWKEVGGKDVPITVLNRGKERSEADMFCHYFGIKYEAIRAKAVVGDNADCIAAVAGDRGAISYMSVGEVEREARHGATVRALPIDGVTATSAAVRRGNYPLSRPLTLVTDRLPMGLRKAFIDFALSSEVTDLVEKYSFVPYLD